jgi:acetyl-CoA carboxylase alpha subunit
MAQALRERLIQELDVLSAVSLDDLVESRYRRLRQYGAYQG